MSEFPVTIEGHVFENRDALVEELRTWGHARARRHRGDRHSADRFNHAVGASSPAAPALAAAAAELLRTSSDPGVLELIAHLTLPGTSVELYEALLDRLEGKGPPLPTGHGLRHGSLAAELHFLLSEWLPATSPELARRGRKLLRASKHGRSHLAFACRNLDGVDEMTAALAHVSDLETDPYLAVYALAQAVEHHPARALELARAIGKRGISSELRELVSRELARVRPSWFAQHGTELHFALGFS